MQISKFLCDLDFNLNQHLILNFFKWSNRSRFHFQFTIHTNLIGFLYRRHSHDFPHSIAFDFHISGGFFFIITILNSNIRIQIFGNIQNLQWFLSKLKYFFYMNLLKTLKIGVLTEKTYRGKIEKVNKFFPSTKENACFFSALESM